MASDFTLPSIRVFSCSPVLPFFPPTPSGLRGPPFFVTSLWSLRLRVTSFWSFVTSSRVRFFLLPSGPCNHFFSALPCGPGVRASLSPGPSSLHPGLTSRSPFAGRNSPAPAIREPARFPHTLLIWSCVRVRPAFSDLSRFSVSAVTKQLRNPIVACTSGTNAVPRQRICIFRLETSPNPGHTSVFCGSSLTRLRPGCSTCPTRVPLGLISEPSILR